MQWFRDRRLSKEEAALRTLEAVCADYHHARRRPGNGHYSLLMGECNEPLCIGAQKAISVLRSALTGG